MAQTKPKRGSQPRGTSRSPARARRTGATPRKHDPDRPERPDVEIGAVVRAKRLRFKRVPDTEVRFPGEAGSETSSGTERENLPDEVEPGVEYRDVRVRRRAAARIRDDR